MDYLYREKVLSSPVSNAVITKDYVVLHHHATLRVFDYRFNIIAERYFYDLILGIEKLGKNEIIVLFRGGQAVQMTHMLEPVALRMVDAAYERMDVHKLTGIGDEKERVAATLWGAKGATVFERNERVMQVVRFGDVGLMNVECVKFYRSYVPTLVVVSRVDPKCHCSLLALDSQVIVETFEIMSGVLDVVTQERFIVFLYRNYIQIKFKREVSTLILGAYPAPDSAFVAYDGAAAPLVLENPQALFVGGVLHLLNGDGCMYRVELTCDSKRVTKADIVFLLKMASPSAIDQHDDLVIVASLEGDTVLYQADASDAAPSFQFIKMASLAHAGLATSMLMKGETDILFTTTEGAATASVVIHFQALEKVKLTLRAESMETCDGEIVVRGYGEEQRVRVSRATGYGLYPVADSSGLFICRDGTAIRHFPGAQAWDLSNSLLCCATAHGITILSTRMNKVLFYSASVYSFEHRIPNESFYAGDRVEEYSGEAQQPGDGSARVDRHRLGPCELIITEMLVVEAEYPLLLLRTAKQLYVYRLVGRTLYKVFVPRYLFFDSGASLFAMEDCIYLRAKIPCLMFYRRGIRIHQINSRFVMGLSIERSMYFISKGYLIRTALPEGHGEVSYSGDYVTKKVDLGLDVHTLVNDLSSNKIVQPVNPRGEDAALPDSSTYMSDTIDLPPHPRYVVHSGESVVVAMAKYVPFIFVPFIPMVHTSNGPGCDPTSEPINPEPEALPGPKALGRTLQYTIELRDGNYAVLHTLALEPYELICDMRCMLDGLVVICTAFPEGEEKLVKGRVLIYAIRDIVPDPSNPHINKRLVLIGTEPTKAPCLAAAEVRGLLAVCVGTRLMIYEVDAKTGITEAQRSVPITAIGRNEIALLSVSLYVVDNLIAVVDLHRGVHFFFLRPRDPLRLHLLSKGSPIGFARHIQGIVYSNKNGPFQNDLLSLAVIDMYGTIHIYTYSPSYPASRHGQRLIKRAEICTELRSTNIVPFTAAGALCRSRSQEALFLSNGIVSCVSAISSDLALALQSAVASAITTSCGINPRNYLEPRQHVNMECRGVISEHILLEFFFMDPKSQEEILYIAGCTWQDIAEIFDSIL